MKISAPELQKYIAAPLPSIAEVVDAFTFHSFEIDGIEGDVLDIKVLPNRAADCTGAEGVARELAAILDLPLINDSEPERASHSVTVTPARINGILGSNFSSEEMQDVFRRLRFRVETDGDTFVITPPASRKDILIPEDIAEEVGRILGYERVNGILLPSSSRGADQRRFRGIERMKDELIAAGFTETSTQSFVAHGEVSLANPLDSTRPDLRPSLVENLATAYAHAKQYALRTLLPSEKPKLFEIGTVFPASGEYLELRTTEPLSEGVPESDNLTAANLEEYGKDYVPKRYALSAFKPFSSYPFATRDIAFWAPAGVDAELAAASIRDAAGSLLVRLDLFDTFAKGDRTSFAFRLVLEAPDRTLTETELNDVLTRVADRLRAKQCEIR